MQARLRRHRVQAARIAVSLWPLAALEEMAAYEARWPVGTRERVWFDILAYTGLRRSDAVRLGRGNLRNGLISIRTKKTDTPVTMPLHPALARSLEAGPIAGKGDHDPLETVITMLWNE